MNSGYLNLNYYQPLYKNKIVDTIIVYRKQLFFVCSTRFLQA